MPIVSKLNEPSARLRVLQALGIDPKASPGNLTPADSADLRTVISAGLTTEHLDAIRQLVPKMKDAVGDRLREYSRNTLLIIAKDPIARRVIELVGQHNKTIEELRQMKKGKVPEMLHFEDAQAIARTALQIRADIENVPERIKDGRITQIIKTMFGIGNLQLRDKDLGLNRANS